MIWAAVHIGSSPRATKIYTSRRNWLATRNSSCTEEALFFFFSPSRTSSFTSPYNHKRSTCGLLGEESFCFPMPHTYLFVLIRRDLLFSFDGLKEGEFFKLVCFFDIYAATLQFSSLLFFFYNKIGTKTKKCLRSIFFHQLRPGRPVIQQNHETGNRTVSPDWPP